MKEGWTYKKIKEVCTSITDGDWIEKKDQSQSGIRLIQTGNIGVGEFIPKDDSHRYISEDTFNRLKCTEIFEGDILISRLPNPLGRSCILPKLDTKCITAVDCSILRTKSDELLPKFFVYYTQSQGYFSKINAESSGTTRARITRKKLEETTIPTPSISVQQRIVERLDSAFENIDKLKANAEKQLAEARTLFQKSLAKAMEPKEGWEEMKLGEFAFMKAGDFVKASDIHKEFSEGLYPCYGGNGLRGYVKEPNQEGDYCLIGRQGALCGCINRASGIFRTTEHAVIVKPYKEIPTSLVYYLLTQLNLNKYATGAAQPGLSVNNIAEVVRISIPPAKDYQRIAERLDSLSENVRKYEKIQRQIISECDALKQALLRKVFE